MRSLLISCLALSSAAIFAQDPFNKDQIGEIEQVVQNYLTNHPEIITNSIQNVQENLAKQKVSQAEEYVKDNMSGLLDLIAPYTIVTKNAKTTLISFIDYRCSYCRILHNNINMLNIKDMPVNISYIPFPILGPESIKAATVALSSSLSNFMGVNEELFAEHSQLNKIIKKYKIKMISNENVQLKLKNNYEWASHLGIQGAPAVIITNGNNVKILFGLVDQEVLKENIQAMDLASNKSDVLDQLHMAQQDHSLTLDRKDDNVVKVIAVDAIIPVTEEVVETMAKADDVPAVTVEVSPATPVVYNQKQNLELLVDEKK